LPPIQDDNAAIDRASRFVGRYRGAGSQDDLIVAGGEQGLYIDGARPTQLIRNQATSFYVAAMSAELVFGDERDGLFRRMDVRGDLPGLDPVWIRTES
jgi:hypothetical protein